MKHIFILLVTAAAFSAAAKEPEGLSESDVATAAVIERFRELSEFPKEAGGSCTNYTIRKYPDAGEIRTWHCVGKGFIVVSHASDKPANPTDPDKLLSELKRLQILHSYARDAGSYLMDEGRIQLAETKSVK